MTIRETTPSREAALSGRLAYLNTGAGTAAVELYGGTKPAAVTDPPGTPLLASVPLDNPVGAVSGGMLTLAPADAGLILETGIATWARAVNRDGATAFDMDAGVTGGGAECQMPNTNLYAGGQVAISSAALS